MKSLCVLSVSDEAGAQIYLNIPNFYSITSTLCFFRSSSIFIELSLIEPCQLNLTSSRVNKMKLKNRIKVRMKWTPKTSLNKNELNQILQLLFRSAYFTKCGCCPPTKNCCQAGCSSKKSNTRNQKSRYCKTER